MSWHEIDRIITKDFIAKFDKPYNVVLIRPADDKRSKCQATIITRTVLQLLLEAHQEELKRKSIELFCGVGI